METATAMRDGSKTVDIDWGKLEDGRVHTFRQGKHFVGAKSTFRNRVYGAAERRCLRAWCKSKGNQMSVQFYRDAPGDLETK